MSVNSEEVCAGRIAARDDEVCADVSLVAEEVLLEHSHACCDARLAACGEGVKFEVGRDESSGEFGVCSCTGAGTPDLWGDVMKLLAVLQ